MWLTLCAAIASFAGLAAADPGERLMNQATACDERRDASQALTRLRSEGSRCVTRYAAVAASDADPVLVKRALTRQPASALERSRRSGPSRADDEAATLFARAVTASRNTKPDKAQPSPTPRLLRVVIDPGHGGKDPGAIGVGGLMEKDIVLDVAKRVRAILKGEKNIAVHLTRSDDRFLSLEERTTFAGARDADLFVSIHANASPTPDAKGAEIYVLGRSSDADANATAQRENTVPDQRTLDTNALIQAMLADLSDSTREEQSLEFAYTVKESFTNTVAVRYRMPDLAVKRAPFYVLLNTGMPSILSEISFVSNPTDAARLGKVSFRQAVAEALAAGIAKYVKSPVLAKSSE